MAEQYPDDAALLALKQDGPTGVEYIPTGQSPYYLEFRKLIYRLLRAAERANDLRVYQAGDLSIGVRPGRAYLQDAAVAFSGDTDIPVPADATVYAWLDSTGNVQTDTNGFPADRRTFVPLAEVITGDSAIESINDRRGEAFLQLPTLKTLGVSASEDEINQALAGISDDVQAWALDFLCAGPDSTVDALHRHLHITQNVDGEGAFTLENESADAAANMALRLSLPNRLPVDTFLQVNPQNGFLRQSYDGQSYSLVGTVHRQFTREGTVDTSINNGLVGAVPITGRVVDVVLSVGTNIESDDNADGLTATAKVNGNVLTTTDPAITAGVGGGFRCTDQGDGTPAAVKDDGTEQVGRGDLLQVDLAHAANGNISQQPTDVAVLVVIEPDAPA